MMLRLATFTSTLLFKGPFISIVIGSSYIVLPPNKTPIGYSRGERAEFLDSRFHTLGKVLLISLSKSYLSRDIQNTFF